MRTSRLGAALFLIAVLLPAPAAAQSLGAIALDQLDPTPAGDPFFGVPSPFAGGHVVPRVQALLSYADAPLTLTQGGVEREVVGSQSSLYLGVSVALWDRLLGSIVLPIAVLQSGEGVATPEEPSPGAPASPAFGDLRLGARVRVLGEERDPFQLAAGAAVHVPTGVADAYVSEGSVRVAPQVSLGGRLERQLVWSATAGATFRSSGNPSTLTYGGGAALLLLDERLQVGPELYAATPIQTGALELGEGVWVKQERTTRAEALLGVRARSVWGIVLGAALGRGFGEGVGTPSFRVLGTLSWAPAPLLSADDTAGLSDVDEDGLPGAQDACPYAYGPRSADPKRNGCPAEDRDEDGVPDPDDACPATAGVTGAGAARRGCPPDADGDGVQDALDFCPAEPAPARGESARPGCPPPASPPEPPETDGDP
jgi:OmpA-OmpF porin, OOP family